MSNFISSSTSSDMLHDNSINKKRKANNEEDGEDGHEDALDEKEVII